MSIQNKFLAAAAVILGCISSFIFLYYPAEYRKVALGMLENKVKSMGQMVALGVGAGRELNNFGVIQQALDWAKHDRNLSYVVVLDEAGEEVARHNPGGRSIDIARLTRTPDFVARDEIVSLTVPIRYENKDYGTLVIGYSLADLKANIARNTETSLRVSLGIFVLGIALSVLLSQKITRPILQLKRSANEFADNGENIRIEVDSSDEVGDLAKSFQAMVEKINLSMAEIRQVNEDLEIARDRAQKANQAKSEFLSRMSHELRTPMNAILGFGQLLDFEKNDPLSDQQRARVGEILKAGAHLLALINEVLDLSRIESGKLSLSIENVDMGLVIDEALSWVQPMADEKHIRLINLSQGAENLWVRGDRTRLKQVLLNLLSNGVKYNRVKGRLTLECENTPDGRMSLRVIDTGKGIAPDKIDHLFEPFNRLDADQGNIEGTGIGLSIARRLVELMEGAITVESVPGKGSTFAVHLPCGRPQKPMNLLHRAELISGKPEAGQQKSSTLLYIEDNPANLRLVQEIVATRKGIRLIFSPQARLGIDLARTHRPDVILMDIHLPGLDGISALRLMKQDEEIRHIPVVAVSANAVKADIDKALQEGFEAYIIKPIRVDQFFKVTDKYFGPDHETASPKPSTTGATI